MLYIASNTEHICVRVLKRVRVIKDGNSCNILTYTCDAGGHYRDNLHYSNVEQQRTLYESMIFLILECSFKKSILTQQIILFRPMTLIKSKCRTVILSLVLLIKV